MISNVIEMTKGYKQKAVRDQKAGQESLTEKEKGNKIQNGVRVESLWANYAR